MFGLPPGNPLREAVVELTQDHTRTVKGVLGTEPPLLRLLEVAVKADTSGASGGAGRSKTSAPLDVTALVLWESIADVVGRNWPGRGNPTHQRLHLIDRLVWWTRTVAGGPHERHLLEFAEFWVKSIRELLEPTRRIPLRGVECMNPECKQTWMVERREDGVTQVPALTARIADTIRHGVEVRCHICGEEWSGLALQLLAS